MRKPRSFDYNVIVIGGGSAGLVAAYLTSALKAKVALIEKNEMGGDCLNTGCVPSKALIRSAKLLSDAKRAKEFGFKSAKVDFEFAEVMDRVQSVIRKIAPHDSIERYTSLGVDCIQGEAELTSPWSVAVNGRSLTARALIVATGGSPAIPKIPGLEKISYQTTEKIWKLRQLPKRLLILGGGPIGAELAQCFQRLGSQVTIVERSPHLLSREDQDVSRLIRSHFEKEGICVCTEHEAKEFLPNKTLICLHQGTQVELPFDEVLIAVGRKARTEGFGLEKLGVKLTEKGTIRADEFLRTNYPSIYVCGDVTGPFQFTHFGAHQAGYAALNALFSPFKKFKADYRVIPWTTFTDPEIARVGLSEAEAQSRNIAYEKTVYDISELDRAITEEEARGFVKVLTAPRKDKILGVTIAGSTAGEMLAEYVLAMKWGIGLNQILNTIHTYPTRSEANKYAAGAWKKAHAPQWALRMLERFHAWRR